MSIETMQFTVRHTPTWPIRGKIHHISLELLEITYESLADGLWVNCWVEWTVQIVMHDDRIRCFHDQTNLQGKSRNLYATHPVSARIELENFVYTPGVSTENAWFEMTIKLELSYPDIISPIKQPLPPCQEIKIWAPCRILHGHIEHVVFAELNETPAMQISRTLFDIEGEFLRYPSGGLFAGQLHGAMGDRDYSFPFTIVIPIGPFRQEEAKLGGVARLVNIDEVFLDQVKKGLAAQIELEWWLTVNQEMEVRVAKDKQSPDKEYRLFTIAEQKEAEIVRTLELPCEDNEGNNIDIDVVLSRAQDRITSHGRLFYGEWSVSCYLSSADGQEHHSEFIVPWNWWWEMDNEMSPWISADYSTPKAVIQGNQLIIKMNARFMLLYPEFYQPVPFIDGEYENIAAERLAGEVSISLSEEVVVEAIKDCERILDTRWNAKATSIEAFDGWLKITTRVDGELDYQDTYGQISSQTLCKTFVHAINTSSARKGYRAEVGVQINHRELRNVSPNKLGFILLMEYHGTLWQPEFIFVSRVKAENGVTSFAVETAIKPQIVIDWEEEVSSGEIKRVLSSKFWLSRCREEIRAGELLVEGEIRSIVEWEDTEGYRRRSDLIHPFWQIVNETHESLGMTILKKGSCTISPRWAWGDGQFKLSVILEWVKLPNETKEEWGIASPHLIRRRGAAFTSADAEGPQDTIDHWSPDDSRASH